MICDNKVLRSNRIGHGAETAIICVERERKVGVINLKSANRVRSLGTVSGLALCATMSNPAFAQEVDTVSDQSTIENDAGETSASDDEGIIIVSGFRAALESAQSLKENADTFVDVITAEDFGALPDRSVAEALQRVPGVTISRFEQRDDPDRFSVEGSGVVIRGLPYVRSELNGRDIFSANGGRNLSFNDVSPELLGRVEVFKNTTADMIDGGISGTVNLVTRNPLDNPGWHIAGTVEANFGDLAEEWSPGFSVLGSGTWESSIGTFGLQVGYAQQELVTRTDASQVTDPCYRAPALDAACIRVRAVGSGGFSGGTSFDASNFPPSGSVIVPKGAGVRTTDLTRDRNAWSVVGQFESIDRRFVLTVEYLRAETDATIDEFSALALVNDDGLFPVIAPGTTPSFNGNMFQSGTLTQFQPFTGGSGIPTEMLRFQREDQAMTEDFSAEISFEATDRLRFNFEGQYINSDRTENGFIGAMQTYTDVFLDNSGETPIVQFFEPTTGTSPAGYFTNPARSLYWFLLDNQVANEGDLYTLRADAEYDIGDGFLRNARFGARWSDRSRTTRSANFSNWGNLGAPWTGRGGNWNCGDFQAFGCGGAYAADFPGSSNVYSPFGNGFQRGNVPIPFGDGSTFFFGGDNLVQDYLSGAVTDQANAITAFTLTPNAWFPISARGNVVPGLPWTPGEISDVGEDTLAFYARVDFGHDFDSGVSVEGNIGLRYVETTIQSGGEIGFPVGDFFDTNMDGLVSVAEIQAACANIQQGQVAPGYCGLSAGRQAEFASIFTGELIEDDADINFSHWLPSFNVKFDFNNGMVLRGAVSRGISRPDLGSFRTGGQIADNTSNLLSAGTLGTGPLFQISTGNRSLRPVESWNYDLSFEYYFARVGSVTASLFAKDVSNIVNFGSNVRSFTSPSGVTTDVAVNGAVNSDSGWLYGVELAHQQTYDFLPGPLAGLGSQITYTYVDAGSFENSALGAEQSPFVGGLPLAGVSEHTVNAVLFYEMYGISARVAYNWRSEFLQTPRDVIFPFSPIYGESTGQLDASIFYSVTDNFKVGVQAVNLLDEVTRTSQVIDFAGTRATRSAFRNDRRYTFLARFDF
jgi:TonB-dependent receptor